MPAKKKGKIIDVSIVIPTLNEEKNMVRLKALKKQVFNGTYEIIIADGYSEDKTVEIAKTFADKVVLEKRRSIAFERQAGAKVAQGKIIAFTDSDADIPTDWVQKIWDAFEADPGLSMIYGPVFYWDVSKHEQALASFFMPKFMRVMSILGMHNPIGSNIAIRKEVFEKIGGFNTEFITCEDLDLGKRAKKHGPMRYVKHIDQFVSARRTRKWGYMRFVGFHLFNGIRYHVTGKASRKYEDIRE